MRSAIDSASSWSCVTMIVVTPRRCCSERISPRRRTRSSASSADSGSSSSSRPGEVASARASAMRCCCPPESWPGYFAAAVGQADQRQQLVDARPDRVAALAPVDEAVGDVVGDREVREQRVRLEDDAVVAPDRRQPRDVAPSWTIVPASCVSSPAMMRSSVVLPQPEGPRKQTSSPRSTASAMSLERLEACRSSCGCRRAAGTAQRDRRAATARVPLPSLAGARAPHRERRSRRDAPDSLLRLGLDVVALGPFGEDLVAVLRGPGEVVLDQALLVVGRHVRRAASRRPAARAIAKFLA